MKIDERTALDAAHKIVREAIQSNEYCQTYGISTCNYQTTAYPEQGFGSRVVEVDGGRVAMPPITSYSGGDTTGHIHIDPEERYVLVFWSFKYYAEAIYRIPHDLVVSSAVLGCAPPAHT